VGFIFWQLARKDNARYTWPRRYPTVFPQQNFPPDFTILATSGQNGPLILWELASRLPLVTLTNFGGDMQDWAFTPDGKMLGLWHGGPAQLTYGISRPGNA